MLISAGVEIPLIGRTKQVPNSEPMVEYIVPEVVDWHNRRVPDMEYVGMGINALNKSLPGDIIIIYDGITHHIGIISGPQKTISSSSITNTIVENDWGWR